MNDYFEQGSNDAAVPVPIMNMLSPVGKLGGAYQDGSPLLVFLACKEASYINGQIINIDGDISGTNPAAVLEGLAAMKEK